MVEINLYKEKAHKKEQSEKVEDLKCLREEIEIIRDELNSTLLKKNKVLSSTDILEVSTKLDKLIAKFLNGKNEYI